MTRKAFLSVCTLAVGTIGIMFALTPFVASWAPNPKSASVRDIDISKIPPGGSVTFEWRKKPVKLYKPSPEIADYLFSLNDVTNGPDYSTENLPEFFVYTMLSTHLGCALNETGPGSHSADGLVGYYNPCHRGFWDYAGRLIPEVYGGRGLENLAVVKDYVWITDTVIRFER